MAAPAATNAGGPHRGRVSEPRQARRGRIGLFALALGYTLLLIGCASKGPAPIDGWDWKGPVPPGYYLVQSGDTLGGIAEQRGLSTRELIRWNRLKPPYVIYAGKLLRVAPAPRGGAFAARVAEPVATEQKDPAQTTPRAGPRVAPGSPVSRSGLTWVWPLDGTVHQGFRTGDRTRQGLRIGCRRGEPVRAAAGGQVVYAGSGLKGYGNLIIVKHNEKYLSAYGFNRRLLVVEGDGVKRGQAVAECGQGVGGAHLMHFEIRRDGVAIDPIQLLPARP